MLLKSARIFAAVLLIVSGVLLLNRSLVIDKPKPAPRQAESGLKIFDYPAVLPQEESGVLGDVKAHLKNWRTYADPDRITAVHECTHGINSEIRNQTGRPCFYLLGGRYSSIGEFETTIRAVAKAVAPENRGRIFDTYLVKSAEYWDRQPSYLFDELASYANGVVARKELGITDRKDAVEFACEMFVYCLYVVKVSGSQDIQARELLKFEGERLPPIECGPIRDFATEYFGKDWAAEHIR